MAFIEMTCNCSASFQADLGESESLITMWAQSFINAHHACGFMNRVVTDSPEKTRKFELERDVMYKERKEKEL
jgi:hypothetical protein